MQLGTGQGWSRHEVFFGEVPAAAWEQFAAEEITPRFPEGFTVVEAAGQWQNSEGIIGREESRVLVLLTPNDPATRQAVQTVADAFKARFQQEAVLVVETPARVDFR